MHRGAYKEELEDEEEENKRKRKKPIDKQAEQEVTMEPSSSATFLSHQKGCFLL